MGLKSDDKMGKKFINIYNRIGNEPYNEKNEIKSNKEKQINKETRIDKTRKYYYNLVKNIMNFMVIYRGEKND